MSTAAAPRSVLILGGAGFLGSNIAARFVRAGAETTIVDGLLPRTGGRRENLRIIPGQFRFIESRVEALADLGALVAGAELIVDAMAWTSHRLAFEDPAYDIQLNLLSHLPLLDALGQRDGGKVVYLGSRGQYGNVPRPTITERDAMQPLDVQGIDKLAAESYFRVYSRRHGFDAVSLRLPNCFGPNQPRDGEEIGLIGSFVRDLLAGRRVEVYGSDRRRPILFAADVAEAVHALASHGFDGFTAYNLNGYTVPISRLATLIAELAGAGEVVRRELPDEVAASDVGSADLSASKLTATLGSLTITPLETALSATVRYFEESAH